MDNRSRKRISNSDRIKVYNLCSGHCAYCGCDITRGQMQVDHYIPLELACLAEGHDINSVDNYLPACRSCNNYKSSMHIEKFRLCITKWHDVLMRDSVTYRNAVRFGQILPAKHTQEFYFEKVGVKIPAMIWDLDYRIAIHKIYFPENENKDSLRAEVEK